MKIQTNARSHREDMRATAARLREISESAGTTLTGEDYGRARRRVAAMRRAEQATARARAGISRSRVVGKLPKRGPVGQIQALAGFFGR